MKLLYISNTRIPTEKAHGIQIMKMCEAFSEHCEVELVVPKRKSKQLENIDPFSFYGVKRSFTITTLKSFDPYWLMKLPQGIYIKFQIVCFLISIFFFFIFKKRERDAIFYTRDEYLLPLLHRLSPRIVWEAHNLPKNKKYYVKHWKLCSRIVVLTGFIKQELVLLGVGAENIIISPDGIDLDMFSKAPPQDTTKKALGLPQDKKIILYTGHLYEWKGAQVLADAANYLDDGYCIVFFGGTSYETDKFRKINSGKKNIMIFPHVSHEKIPAILSFGDILVIPNSAKSNISKFYTSPLKFFEYLSTSKPIVASDVPSLHEIGDKFSGIFYFSPDDPKDLAQKIQNVSISKSYLRDLTPYNWKARSQFIFSHL